MAKTETFDEHWLDDDGNPAGGVASSKGVCISWQNGPLGRGNERREPNGGFVENVIAHVISVGSNSTNRPSSNATRTNRPSGTFGSRPMFSIGERLDETRLTLRHT